MWNRRLIGGFLFGLLGLPTLIQAQEEKWTHYGLRPLAMGNAFVSVANDYNALFYNPAGLARLESWDFEFLNPTLELSEKTVNFISDAAGLAQGDSDSVQKTLDLIEEQVGHIQHLAIQWTPHFILPHFGIGIGIDLGGSMLFHRYPSIALIRFGPKVIVPMAIALNFLEDRLSVGFGIKLRAQGGVDDEFSIDSIEAFSDSEQLDDKIIGGSGVGGDFGILFTPIKTMAPTIGLSITDIGGTTYNKMDISGKPLGTPKITLPSVNLGFSMRPWEWQSMYLLTAVEMHSVNQPFSFSKKINYGMEWGLGSIFKVQTGLHQGYLSGGFELDVGILAIRAVSYAEELGHVSGTVMDRRYAMQLKLLI